MRHFPRGDDLAVVPPIKKDENRKEATSDRHSIESRRPTHAMSQPASGPWVMLVRTPWVILVRSDRAVLAGP